MLPPPWLAPTQVFQQAAEAAGFSLKAVPPPAPSASSSSAAGPSAASSSQASLRTAAGDGEYFCALLPDGTRLVRPIMRGARVRVCSNVPSADLVLLEEGPGCP